MSHPPEQHGKHHQMLVTEHEHPDAWHTHTTDEPMPQHEHASEIAARRIIWMGVIGFILLAIVCQATIEYFKYYAQRLKVDREEGAPLYVAADKYRADSLAQLQSPTVEYVPQGNYIRVPLPEATKRVMTRYAPK